MPLALAAPAIDAVFIDGVGHIKRMKVTDERPDFRFPEPQSYRVNFGGDIADYTQPVFREHRFVRIGRLTDRRVVYGLDSAHLSLWLLRLTITHERLQTDKDAENIPDREVSEWLRQCGQPALCLLRTYVDNFDKCVRGYLFEGVGRQLTDSDNLLKG